MSDPERDGPQGPNQRVAEQEAEYRRQRQFIDNLVSVANTRETWGTGALGLGHPSQQMDTSPEWRDPSVLITYGPQPLGPKLASERQHQERSMPVLEPYHWNVQIPNEDGRMPTLSPKTGAISLFSPSQSMGRDAGSDLNIPKQEVIPKPIGSQSRDTHTGIPNGRKSHDTSFNSTNSKGSSNEVGRSSDLSNQDKRTIGESKRLSMAGKKFNGQGRGDKKLAETGLPTEPVTLSALDNLADMQHRANYRAAQNIPNTTSPFRRISRNVSPSDVFKIGMAAGGGSSDAFKFGMAAGGGPSDAFKIGMATGGGPNAYEFGPQMDAGFGAKNKVGSTSVVRQIFPKNEILVDLPRQVDPSTTPVHNPPFQIPPNDSELRDLKGQQITNDRAIRKVKQEVDSLSERLDFMDRKNLGKDLLEIRQKMDRQVDRINKMLNEICDDITRLTRDIFNFRGDLLQETGDIRDIITVEKSENDKIIRELRNDVTKIKKRQSEVEKKCVYTETKVDENIEKMREILQTVLEKAENNVEKNSSKKRMPRDETFDVSFDSEDNEDPDDPNQGEAPYWFTPKVAGTDRRRAQPFGHSTPKYTLGGVPPVVPPGRAPSQINRAPRANTDFLKTIPKMDKYKGETRWEDFINQFNKMANLMGWTQAFKLDALHLHLGGAALHYFESLAPNTKNNYQNLLSAMERRFGPDLPAEAQRTVFHGLKRKDKETFRAFADRVRETALEAYPNLKTNYNEEIMVPVFLKGLGHPDAALANLNKNFTTLDEALRGYQMYIENHKAIFGKQGSTNTNTFGGKVRRELHVQWSDLENSSEDEPSINQLRFRNNQRPRDRSPGLKTKEVAKVENNSGNEMAALRKAIEQLSKLMTDSKIPSREQNRAPQNSTPKTSPKTSPRKSVCFNCRKEGHFWRECPEEPKDGKDTDKKTDLN